MKRMTPPFHDLIWRFPKLEVLLNHPIRFLDSQQPAILGTLMTMETLICDIKNPVCSIFLPRSPGEKLSLKTSEQVLGHQTTFLRGEKLFGGFEVSENPG